MPSPSRRGVPTSRISAPSATEASAIFIASSRFSVSIVYEEYDQVANVLLSEAGDFANEQLLQVADVVNLSYYVQAFREIYATKEISSAEDLAGVKIRVPESSLYVNTFSMLDAAPTPLPLGEVYTAMDTGVVDAVENIPDTAVHNSWVEVAPYMIVTNHLNAPSTIYMSNKVFSGLNQDEQNLLLQAGYENFFYALELSQEKDAQARDELAEVMTVITPDIQSMRDKIDYTNYDFMELEEAQKLKEGKGTWGGE
ncbi:MAG: TRAP transporter substrate-binding protein [Lachnospiraceae bacterium]|nr:TRAP transporter substrate-binding protein [Lachnospiraceae bacterium]